MPGLDKSKWWWGYLDINDIVHVKRYTTDRAIENAEKSPLTKGIFDLFTANNYKEAKLKMMNCYAQEIMGEEICLNLKKKSLN
jgi:hypothetical protein